MLCVVWPHHGSQLFLFTIDWLKLELDSLMFSQENENTAHSHVRVKWKKRRNMLNYHFPSHNTIFSLSVYKFNYRCHHSTWLETQWFSLSLSPLLVLRVNVNVMSSVTLLPCCFLYSPSSNASHSAHANTHTHTRARHVYFIEIVVFV